MFKDNYTSLIKSLILILLVFIQIPSNAQNKELSISVDSWPPFRIINDKKYSGIDFDLWNEVSKRMNLKIDIKEYPWSRSLLNMKHGKVDAMSGVAKREERALYMHYISPSYYTCSTVFYVKKGNSHFVQKYDDLKKYLIGYVANSAYFSPFDTDKTLIKRSVTTEAQLIRMLAVGRLKVIIGTDCQVDYDIARMGYNEKIEKAIYKPNNNVDLYITISKKSPYAKHLDEINKTIKEIVEEGKVKEFAKKYYE